MHRILDANGWFGSVALSPPLPTSTAPAADFPLISSARTPESPVLTNHTAFLFEAHLGRSTANIEPSTIRN
jgi:hypothetical protein